MVFNKELSAARQAGARARLPGRRGRRLGGGWLLHTFRDVFAFSGQLGSLMKKE